MCASAVVVQIGYVAYFSNPLPISQWACAQVFVGKHPTGITTVQFFTGALPLSLHLWLRLLFPAKNKRSRRARSYRDSARLSSCERLEDVVLLSTVSGVVFQDQDVNGVRDSGERPIRDMIVTLWDVGVDNLVGTNDDILTATSRTNALSEYSFSLSGNTQYVVQFGTQFGAYRFSASDQDASSLTSTSISADGISSMFAGGPLSSNVQINAGLDNSVPGQILNRRLQQSYSFQQTHPTFQQNAYRQQEKWLRANATVSPEWYFISTQGDLFRWDRISGVASGEFIATVGPNVYANPLLLVNAAAVPDLNAIELPELAWELDSQVHFVAARTWYESYGNLNVKWIAGDKNQFGNRWYFIQADGALTAWDGTARQASGTKIAQLSSAYFADPVLLTNAIRPISTDKQAGLIREAFGILRSAPAPATIVNPAAAWFVGAQNQFGNDRYFVRSNGEFVAWDGSASETGRLLYTLSTAVHGDPALLANAPFYLDTTTASAAAHDLDRTYGLIPRPQYSLNWGGQQEKWIEGRPVDGIRQWFIVFPNGEVRQATSWNSVTRTFESIPVVQLSPRFYAFPHMLHNAVKPLADVEPPAISLDDVRSTIVSSTNITLTGQVTDNRSSANSLVYQIDSGVITPLSLDQTGRFSLSTSFLMTGLDDGQHKIRFRATDAANNVSAVTTVTLMLDTVTALDTYVAAPDPSYQSIYSEDWEISGPGYTAHVLNMTSQTWMNGTVVAIPKWQHWVTVIVPDGATSNTAILHIGSGSRTANPPTGLDSFSLSTALSTGMIVVNLPTVPNQPQVFLEEGISRSEDGIIAYTFDKFLETGDENYPLLLPMVKSAVATMNAAQAFAATQPFAIDDFIVTGASKRGWTT